MQIAVTLLGCFVVALAGACYFAYCELLTALAVIAALRRDGDAIKGPVPAPPTIPIRTEAQSLGDKCRLDIDTLYPPRSEAE